MSGKYCEYRRGICEESGDELAEQDAFFVYPSRPQELAGTVRNAVNEFNQSKGAVVWSTWERLDTGGKIILCEICKRINKADRVIADITTLNFNVFFEIGMTIGMGKPIVFIINKALGMDYKLQEVGVIDTLGYEPYGNYEEIIQAVVARRPYVLLLEEKEYDTERKQPVFYVKSVESTDGSVKTTSLMKRSPVHFRTFDPGETPRIALYETFNEVLISLGILIHLNNPSITGKEAIIRINTARAALVGGLSLTRQKKLLILQEGLVEQPIDYRDLVFCYDDIRQIKTPYEKFIIKIIEDLQGDIKERIKREEKLLDIIDFGDVAAENEIRQLRSYFVPTPEFTEAIRGNANLIVGRKGTGKTAIFYGIRDEYYGRQNYLILDLKPEGYQFTKLSELISNLNPGIAEHVLNTFWKYLILIEIGRKIVDQDYTFASFENERFKYFYDIQSDEVYSKTPEEGDFSERLLGLVNKLISRIGGDLGEMLETGKISEHLHEFEIKELKEKLIRYLAFKKGVWLLFDNLDKGWPVKKTHSNDIKILRSLLEATRSIKREFQDRGIEFFSLIFIRHDVYEHLFALTPDRGKEASKFLNYTLKEFYKKIFVNRVEASTELSGGFDDLWLAIFPPFVGEENAFDYLIGRTLFRARDFLNFVKKCLEVGRMGGSTTITAECIRIAEIDYSNDMLDLIRKELNDVYPDFPDIIYLFYEQSPRMDYDALKSVISDKVSPEFTIESVIDNLIWFGFLGLEMAEDNIIYSYAENYLTDKLKRIKELAIERGVNFVIHPAFRVALSCK